MITAKLVERLEVYIPVDNATEDTSQAFTTVSNPTAIGSSFGVRYNRWCRQMAARNSPSRDLSDFLRT